MLKNIKFFVFFSLILAILLNINWLHSAVLGLSAGLFYILIFSFLLGKYFFITTKPSQQLILGSFILIAAYSLFGAIIYYFYKLDSIIISLLFIIISAIILFLNYKRQTIQKLKIKLRRLF